MRTALQSVVKRASAAADFVRPTDGLVVLIYHRVGAHTPVSVDLPAALFAEQMALLAERYRVVTLDEAATLLASDARPEGPPCVAVTFDDGTADFVGEALPVLVEHRIPATLYLATRHIDEQISFPDDGIPLSWGAVAEAVATGLVDIGSHTHSHLLLDRVTPAEAGADLDRSIDLIGNWLGVDVRHFAYPKAVRASAAVEPEVRRRFVTAAVARTRPNRYGRTDLHRLTRSPVQVGDGLRWFERKAAGGMGLENDVRDLVNRWRYRNATN